MKGARFLSIIAVAVAIVLLNFGGVWVTHPQAQVGECDYFPETGYYVCDEFLDFFRTRGGLEIFGYPITGAFDDPTRGLRVQYFEHSRMELHPFNPAPYRVQLGLLVDELGYQFPLANEIPAFNTNLTHYFPETNHTVSHAFLDYFREHGGVDIFGYPRSEVLYEDGYIVQYFQRARMEWHPETRSGPQMQLTDLGRVYVERFDISGDQGGAAIIEPVIVVTKLTTTASVRHIITGQTGSQTVFVYVTDQLQRPVSGAAVTLTVRYPSDSARYECPPTDENGFTGHSFDILRSTPGQNVVIDVAAAHGDLTSATQTFFLPWW
jgi:hypothetical protein